MADDDTIRLDDHRPPDDGDSEKIPCAKCGQLIHMYTTRCPHCGIHFRGAAFEFEHPSEHDATPPSRTLHRLTMLLLITLAGLRSSCGAFGTADSFFHPPSLVMGPAQSPHPCPLRPRGTRSADNDWGSMGSRLWLYSR